MKALFSVGLCVLVFLALFCSFKAGLAGSAIGGVESRITTDPADQNDPAISDNIVCYNDYRGGDIDVWYYDLATGTEHRLPTAPGNQLLADVSEGIIVYTDFDAAVVMMYSILTDETKNLTSPSSHSVEATIDHGLVAWIDRRNGSQEIYACNLTDSEERRITFSARPNLRPDVGNGRIVWYQYDSSFSTCDIYCYDWASGTTRQITNTPTGDERLPGSYGNTIVYQGTRDGEKDIYVYDLVSSEERRLMLPGDQLNPNISGDFIAFEDLSSGLYHVSLWHLPTDTVYDIPAAPSSQFLNNIDGNRVVYTDDRSYQQDIYMYTFTADIAATVDIIVDSDVVTLNHVLNLNTGGAAVACYIELPGSLNVANINVSTITLNQTISAGLIPAIIGDHDSDGTPDLMVRFGRGKIRDLIISGGMWYGNVTLTVEGRLNDGTRFEGSRILRVSFVAGDVDCDFNVDISDVVLATGVYGSTDGSPNWRSNANFVASWDKIDILDLVKITGHYGERWP